MQTNNINALQMSLLRLFNRPISEQEILVLKRVLVKQYSILLQLSIQNFEDSTEYDDQDYEAILAAKS